MKGIKEISLCLAASTILLGMAGCKSSSASPTKSGKPLQVSVEVFDRGNCPSSEGTMENNRWTKWVNEQSGVNVTWVPVPRATEKTKIQALFAAGNAPDLVYEYGSGLIKTLQEQGVLQPIDSYISKYSTTYKNYIGKHPELKPFSQIDGKTYSFVSERDLRSIVVHAMYIRQDWLTKLGLKMPATDQDLLNVAKAFVDKAPDENGKADTVGIAFGSAFNTIGANGIIEELYGCGTDYLDNGKYYIHDTTMYDSPRFKDAWQFRKTCYDEHIMDSEYVTDTQYAKENQYLATGKCGIYMGSWDIHLLYRQLLTNVPTADLEPVPLLSTKYGKFALYQNSPLNRCVAMNKNCKNVEAAVKFMDWLLGKGASTLQNGFEGENYKKVNGVKVVIDSSKNAKELDYASEYALIAPGSDFKLSDLPVQAQNGDSIAKKWATLEEKVLRNCCSQYFDRLAPQVRIKDDTLLNNLSSIGSQTDAKVVMGGSKYSVDWGIGTMKSESKRLGGDTVTKETEDFYKTNKAANDKWVSDYKKQIENLVKQ